MRAAVLLFVVTLFASSNLSAGEALFEDDFENGLSPKWQVIGLKKEDYRIRDGGLEIRVPTCEATGDRPMLKVVLPFTSDDTVIASVEVTPLDRFTAEGEFAGMYLTDEDGPEFAAKKACLDGRIVFAPGSVEFDGTPGGAGNPDNDISSYVAAKPEAGPLRILVDRGYAFFQVGPSTKDPDRYLNFFYSAIQSNRKERGFCLAAGGAPAGTSHWVRFDNFRAAHR